jgi:hypothetical protein
VSAMERARQQIKDRDEHCQQPAPVAPLVKSARLAERGHEVTQVFGSVAVAWCKEQCRPATLLRVGNLPFVDKV